MTNDLTQTAQRVDRLRWARDDANHNFEVHIEACPTCNGKTVDEVRAGFGCAEGVEPACELIRAERALKRGY